MDYYSLRQKSLGHFNQTLFSPFSCSPRPSQSCLSQFGHQILYTNIEGTRRPQSVPTILIETVAMASSCSGRKEEKDALHQKFVLGVQNYRPLIFAIFSMAPSIGRGKEG